MAPEEFKEIQQEEAKDIEHYFDLLWPLTRSITGEGVRKTHDILKKILPLTRTEIPTGTEILDWKVPKEWKVNEAYIVTPNGQRILDVNDNNLHLLNYSIPFRGKVQLNELDQHLYSLPELPKAIPYVTSYYKPRWGFCITDQQRKTLKDGEYEVVIDTELFDGNMTISQAVLPGITSNEVLISTYTCHPSMANNELSGPLVSAFLYKRLAQLQSRNLTYRFVFVPETIGAIAFLSLMGDEMKKNCVAGYVLTCIGDSAPITYKKSRQNNSLADQAAAYVLSNKKNNILDFFPSGSDERQYCSPGFNLPIGAIARSIYTDYPEYHTSLDNKNFISFDSMVESIDTCFEMCLLMDRNIRYQNLRPEGEPFLSKYNLLDGIGAQRKIPDFMRVCQWLLNMSDGSNSLLDIANQSQESFWDLDQAAQKCCKAGLLKAL